MLGLAQMAARLAESRVAMSGYGILVGSEGRISIASRERADKDPAYWYISAEYYCICDRISQGKKP